MNEIHDSTFKLTKKGIHLLRNKFTYQLIAYTEIQHACLIKDKSVKNWIVVILFGSILLFLALMLFITVIGSLELAEKSIRYYNLFAYGLIAVMFVGGGGLLALISAIRTVPTIQLKTIEGTYKLRIFKNQKKVKNVLNFLNSHGVKVHS